MGIEPDVEDAGKRRTDPLSRRAHTEIGLTAAWERYLVFRQECDALGYSRGDPRAAELWQEFYKP